jgi:hypothetical protein
MENLPKKIKTKQPTQRPIRVRDVKTASRLMGKIILQIQRDEINHDKAKLLIYALGAYVNISKQNDTKNDKQN